MAEIKSSCGASILVDDEDLPLVSGRPWSLAGGGYATRRQKHPTKLGSQCSVYMHRLIMGLEHGDPRRVDHKNGDLLDNQRDNLRICSHAENMQNRGPTKLSKSGIKGVSWCTRDEAWLAHISANGKQKRIGQYPTKEQAQIAYREAAQRLHGQFAKAT